jgi:hypothetical protein
MTTTLCILGKEIGDKREMSTQLREALAEIGYTHVSPSSLEKPPCLRNFEYLYLGDKRKDMPVGVPAIAGTAAHDGIQGVACDGLEVEFAKEEARKYISKHEPISDLDELKKAQYVDDVEKLIDNGVEELAKLGDITYTSEERIGLYHKALEKSGLEIMGFVDLTADDRIVELKTKWNPLGPPRKDGSRAFRKVKMPTRPDAAHIRQVAVYWAATGKMPYLIYITTEGAVTFSHENCDLMTVESLSRHFNQILHSAVVWENLLSISTDPKVLAMYIEPSWDDFRWRLFMPKDYLNQAEELFKI